MGKSQIQFERWKSRRELRTWAYQVFKKHNAELGHLLAAQRFASDYTYKRLAADGASWDDDPKRFVLDERATRVFESLKDWSETYRELENWIRLNGIIAATSNFEVYLSAVISLALESDPGLLLGASRAVDGVRLLKDQVARPELGDYIISCTKGDWNQRVSAYRKIFGRTPKLLTDNIARLDKIRIIRNKVGHAFGRDIENAKRHWVNQVSPIERLSKERGASYYQTIQDVAGAVEEHLMEHIGEYQIIRFYHHLRAGFPDNLPRGERMVRLKREIGGYAESTGKSFCRELVSYYEDL